MNIPKISYKKNAILPIIKQKALDEDTTVTEIVITAIKEYMSK